MVGPPSSPFSLENTLQAKPEAGAVSRRTRLAPGTSPRGARRAAGRDAAVRVGAACGAERDVGDQAEVEKVAEKVTEVCPHLSARVHLVQTRRSTRRGGRLRTATNRSLDESHHRLRKAPSTR